MDPFNKPTGDTDMTVKELIRLLGTFDENLEVYLEDAEGWFTS